MSVPLHPEVGFVRRLDFARPHLQSAARATRLRSSTASLDYVTNPLGRLETLELRDFCATSSTRPAVPVANGVSIPAGGYTFQEVQTSFNAGPQRRIAGRVGMTRGQFFDGDRTEVSYSGRLEATASLMFEPAVSVNWVDLPSGSFRNTVARSRATFTLSPRSFVGALVQYASASQTVSANVRFRWEYQPGSDLFVVFSEGRDTSPRGLPGLQNRGVVVKFTRLFRF